MKKINLTILIFTLIMIVVTSNGQSISDYFVPKEPYNKVSFFSPGKSGEHTGMTRVLYYVKHESSYNITDAKMFNGQPSSISTITVELTTNEVKMLKSTSTTLFETNKKKSYDPPRIILKMPPFGSTSKWSYVDIPGDIIKCTAKWIKITIDGEEGKTLKVTQEIEGSSSKFLEYYVRGVGLWKTKIEGADGQTQTFDKFESIVHDSTVK